MCFGKKKKTTTTKLNFDTEQDTSQTPNYHARFVVITDQRSAQRLLRQLASSWHDKHQRDLLEKLAVPFKSLAMVNWWLLTVRVWHHIAFIPNILSYLTVKGTTEERPLMSYVGEADRGEEARRV